nr:uncharacterized protein LOC113817882 [Penaeus vannamei]
MRVLIVLSVCVALACAASPPRSAPEAGVEVKARTKRDHPPESSYAVPPTYHEHEEAPAPQYYYPVEMMPAAMEEPMENKKKDKCVVQKLLPPIILITIFLGIIAGSIVGLFPSLTWPAFQQVLPILAQAGNGRSMDDMTTMVTRAVESEECLARLVCESGKLANGYSTIFSMFEFFTPRVFESKMKIFKESALKKTDCKRYSCSYVDGKPK